MSLKSILLMGISLHLIYDPCCGSGGMFVQSEKFVAARGGRIGDISVYGQESNPTTWKLCKMNLAIRGIDCNLGSNNADSFRSDLHKDLKADFIIANPPFNMSPWGGEGLTEDSRWQYGTPSAGNANYAWIQHIISHLHPNGYAGFVLANGSMSSNQSGEGEIRKKIVDGDLVDCMVALPGQLFYNTQIPACLWFLTRNKNSGKYRKRTGETLFIDTRKMGVLIDRVHRELTEEDDEKSDIDFLIDYDLSKTSSWFPMGLILDLEALLKRKVDVATDDSLHYFIRDNVLLEAIKL